MLAERIRELREAAGMSRRALDDRAHLTFGHTQGIECGRIRSPEAATVKAIADALGVTTDALLSDGVEAASAPTDPEEAAP